MIKMSNEIFGCFLVNQYTLQKFKDKFSKFVSITLTEKTTLISIVCTVILAIIYIYIDTVPVSSV